MTLEEFSNEYGTNFGDIDVPDNESYSNLTYKLHITRPVSYFLWKLLLPLLVVFASSILTLVIFAGYIDARISTPIGALLSVVFLQQSYTENLPEVGYMVMMDKIYVLCYILILATLIQVIITANWASSEEEEDYARVKKLDKRFGFVSLGMFLIACLSIIFM